MVAKNHEKVVKEILKGKLVFDENMALADKDNCTFCCKRCLSIHVQTTVIAFLCLGIIKAQASEPTFESGTSAKMSTNLSEHGHPRHHSYLHSIFNKYGDNGLMTFEGFEHLLENLGIGNLQITDHDIHDHYDEDGFRELHPDHNHTVSENGSDTHEGHANRHVDDSFHHNGDHDHSHGQSDDHDDRNYESSGHQSHSSEASNKESSDNNHGHENEDDIPGATAGEPSGVVHGAVKTERKDGNDGTAENENRHHRKRRFAEVKEEEVKEEAEGDDADEDNIKRVSDKSIPCLFSLFYEALCLARHFNCIFNL